MRGKALVGACQRDISQHFPQLSTAAEAAVPSRHRPAAASPPSSSSSSEEEGDDEEGAPFTTAVQLIKLAIAKFHRQHVREAFPLQDCRYPCIEQAAPCPYLIPGPFLALERLNPMPPSSCAPSLPLQIPMTSMWPLTT